jgi:hypothetical protein
MERREGVGVIRGGEGDGNYLSYEACCEVREWIEGFKNTTRYILTSQAQRKFKNYIRKYMHLTNVQLFWKYLHLE